MRIYHDLRLRFAPANLRWHSLDTLASQIKKFVDLEIDLSPAGLDNHHGIDTLFEELVRKFNSESPV
jgi:hypothetical protein